MNWGAGGDVRGGGMQRKPGDYNYNISTQLMTKSAAYLNVQQFTIKYFSEEHVKCEKCHG